MLSICEVIVSQKNVQWRMKVAFLWVGQQFHSLPLPLWAKINTPLYKKGIKTTQIKSMETTIYDNITW